MELEEKEKKERKEKERRKEGQLTKIYIHVPLWCAVTSIVTGIRPTRPG